MSTHIPVINEIEVAEYVSVGVENDGGGFVLVNGVVHRVGPNGPPDGILTLALGLVAARSAEVVADRAVAVEIREIASKVLGIGAQAGAVN